MTSPVSSAATADMAAAAGECASGEAGRPATAAPDLARKVMGEGAQLFAGFATAQGLSFVRNAMIGHALSQGDFGIAATITMMLQLVETLSDLGTDRLIVQARDGDEPRFVAASHLMLVARGLVTSLLLLALAAPAAAFFAVPQAQSAFAALALVPLVKAFMHLDCRRAQRRLDNRPQILVETVPQAAALAATWPLLQIDGGYWVALWLALVQAVVSVVVSHGLAERPYRWAVDGDVLRRLVAFGWPIWASALPLVAVFQGDRIIVGKLLGMEALAVFSAAFMVTMVPGLIAAKVAHALVLPVLVGARDDAAGFRRRHASLMEVATLAAALYLLAFVAVGGAVLEIAFGRAYGGQDAVVAALAVTWAVRMLQAVPGMALMALGETRPFLVAGLVRAAALALSLALAWHGAGLAVVATAGAAGELASLVYVAWRVEAERPGLARPVLRGLLGLVPAGGLGLVAAGLFPAEAGLLAPAAAAALIGAFLIAAARWTSPELFRLLSALRDGGRTLAP